MDDTARLIDAAPRTFFGVPSLRDLDMLDVQVAFLGVPYDGGTPEPGLPTGQRAGPGAAREASGDQFFYPRSAGAGDDPGAEGWYDVEADRDYLVGVTMADVGDVAIQGSDTEGNDERITGAARRIAERGAWGSQCAPRGGGRAARAGGTVGHQSRRDRAWGRRCGA